MFVFSRKGRPKSKLLGKHERNDEYTLRWRTDDGLPRLTQSRRETSSSSTDDDLDDGGSVEWALLGQQNLMVR